MPRERDSGLTTEASYSAATFLHPHGLPFAPRGRGAGWWGSQEQEGPLAGPQPPALGSQKATDPQPSLSLQPSDEENSDNSNECVVCLSDLRDTLILPCRHLCLCNSCADTLRYQASNCPICRLREWGPRTRAAGALRRTGPQPPTWFAANGSLVVTAGSSHLQRFRRHVKGSDLKSASRKTGLSGRPGRVLRAGVGSDVRTGQNFFPF